MASDFSALTDLLCYSNQLESLDVSKNTALTYLDCYNNQLMSLDVSKNSALTHLLCYSNHLESLDVSENTALTYLACSDNQLKSLDVSKNTALTYLDCEKNQLTSLDVTNCTELTTIYANSNTYAVDLVAYTFDLSALPGDFDVTGASDWSNATVDGTILTISDLQQNIGYLYDLGNGSTEYFELVPQSCTLTVEMFAAIEDLTYTGSEITPDVLFGDVTAEDMGWSVSYADNLHAGTASVTITGDGEFYQGEVTVQFTILPRNVEELSFTTGAPLVYSGEELTQQVIITDGEMILTEGEDYRISGNTGTNAGAYIMTITGMGDFTGTYEIPWTIEKAVPEVTPVIEDTVFAEGDALPEISFESLVHGVIEWVTTLVDGLIEGENELEWKFTPDDEENYENATGTTVIEAEATTTTETTTTETTTTTTATTTTSTTASTTTSTTASTTASTTTSTTATTTTSTTASTTTSTTASTTKSTTASTTTSTTTSTTASTTTSTTASTTTSTTASTESSDSTETTTEITGSSDSTETTTETTGSSDSTETTTETTGSSDSTETTTETTGSSDSTETTTETTGSDLPQTGYSDNYKYILLAAAALVLLGAYAMAKSRKPDEK